MKRGRIYLVCIVAIVVVGALYASIGRAEGMDPVRPQMKEGQMFTVKLVPKGSRLEVSIIGREIADFDFDKLGVTARFQVGKKILVASPKKQGGVYWLDAPKAPTADELNLEVRLRRHAEKFDFQLNQAKP